MEFGHGTISEGEQTSGISAAVPIARDRTGKLPASAPLGFATLSHSNLKSYAKIEAAQGHNTRVKDTPNARKDAPAPIELLDEKSGTYVERVKAILREHGQPAQLGKPANPVKPRKGGTIACEDVHGASPEYWNRNGDWKLKSVEEIRNDPVVQAALALARSKHGLRLVSCSLHLDEESPHVHIISVPLIERAHSKRGRKPKDTPRDEKGKPLVDSRPKVTKWTLDVSSIRGRSSDLEKNHDEWAKVCEPFGLVRGARGSDMTKEQRRARRNRQTGRSSHAEKEAREERERLHEEAERSRQRGKNYEKEAQAKTEEAEADRLAAKQEREAVEAATARAQVQEAENERVRGELAEAQLKLDEQKKATDKRAAAVEREAGIHADQMRLIARALDPSTSIDISYADGSARAEGDLDDRDVNAARNPWQWMAGGLDTFATRLTKLFDREADAARAQEDRAALKSEQDQHHHQVEIIRKVLEPNSGLQIEMAGPEIRIVGLEEEQNAAVRGSPAWFKGGLTRIMAGLRSVADRTALLDQREKAVAKREGAADTKNAEADRRLASLTDEEGQLDRIWTAVEATRERATDFLEAWKNIPASDRSPAIAEAYRAATGLSQEDLPQGFNPRGKGGFER